MTTVQLGKQTIQLAGSFPLAGETAPDFNLVNTKFKNRNWRDFADRPCIMYCVTSLDTETCATSTQKLDQLALKLPAYNIIVVSADLPFALQRFEKENRPKHVQCLSTFRDPAFAANVGLLMENGPLAGLLARAIIVINPQQQVTYSQLVCNIGDQPDYDSLLQNTK